MPTTHKGSIYDEADYHFSLRNFMEQVRARGLKQILKDLPDEDTELLLRQAEAIFIEMER